MRPDSCKIKESELQTSLLDVLPLNSPDTVGTYGEEND